METVFLQQFWLHLGLVHRWGVSSGFSSSKALDGIELGLCFHPFPLCLPVRAGSHAVFCATILFASKILARVQHGQNAKLKSSLF